MLKTKIATCGFVLFEVLIATFVLTFGLLGIVAVYSKSLSRTQDLYWRAIATTHMLWAVEQSKVSDSDYSDWAKECKKLLPNSSCSFTSNDKHVCWQAKGKKRCITKMLYD